MFTGTKNHQENRLTRSKKIVQLAKRAHHTLRLISAQIVSLVELVQLSEILCYCVRIIRDNPERSPNRFDPDRNHNPAS